MRKKYPFIPTLEVRYWFSERECPNVGIKNGTVYYAKSKHRSELIRNAIINRIIATGYSVMIRTNVPSQGDAFQIIWISKYGFNQR